MKMPARQGWQQLSNKASSVGRVLVAAGAARAGTPGQWDPPGPGALALSPLPRDPQGLLLCSAWRKKK